jgi:predicted DNA binding CopG/RHH family protein
MSRKKEIDPTFYETNCFADWMEEAAKKGELIRPVPGKSIIDVTREYMQAKKKTTVSMRLPVGVVKKVKERAAVAGVPWTSYICAVLERALAKPQIASRIAR